MFKITTQRNEQVNEMIAAWIILDNVYQYLLNTNSSVEVQQMVLNHRSMMISAQMSIEDFTASLKYSVNN